MRMAGDGSKILLSCNAIDLSLEGKASCQPDGKLATHCPFSCGTCEGEMRADSKATFLFDAETGKTKRCKEGIQELTQEKRKKRCAKNENLKMTCRDSCDYSPA